MARIEKQLGQIAGAHPIPTPRLDSRSRSRTCPDIPLRILPVGRVSLKGSRCFESAGENGKCRETKTDTRNHYEQNKILSAHGRRRCCCPNDQPTYWSNPEVDAKIDAHIRENPKYWATFRECP